MLTFFEKIQSIKYLIIIFLAISFVLLFSNLFVKDYATITSDWLNFLVSSFALVFSVIITVKTGKTGSHGKAWVLFLLCIVFWFVGERIWMVDELVFHEKPWPSYADYFWLVGYLFFFAFSFYYMKPFKGAISKRMVVLATVVPIVISGVTIFVTEDSNSSLDWDEKALANSYPVLDSISLVPVVLGIAIFFRGAVHFTWILLLLGMLCFVVSDLGYLYFSLDDSYYTGHPIDIPYLWAYVLFAFGIMGHLKVFSKTGTSQSKCL